MRKYSMVLAISILLCLFTATTRADSPDDTYAQVAKNAQELFDNEKFEDIDALYARYLKNEDRFDDGGWKLSQVSSGISAGIRSKPRDVSYKMILDWRSRLPKSIGGALSEAQYWRGYAWSARGNGYAYSITSEGARLFQEREKKSETVLLESKPYAAANPLWYCIYIGTENELNHDKKNILETFSEAASRYPYYLDIYYPTIVALQPKWGGSFDMEDKFIRGAVEITKEKELTSFYARLYRTLDSDEELGFDPFRDAKASWPVMKTSFEDLMKVFPNSLWNLNSFASYACKAGDKDTFINLFHEIGTNIVEKAWLSNFSPDVCSSMYSTKT